MVRMGVLAAAFVLAAGYLGHADSVWAFDPWQPHEQWVLQAGRVAPWADPGTRAVAHASLKGQAIQVDGDQVRAPAPLACEQASHSFVVTPAEGLFEGGLPDPAAQSARTLGITSLPLLTWRMTCRNSSFDVHLLPKRQALLGLDHVVWRLTRTGAPVTPEAAVLELLREHLTHEMAFSATTVQRKQSQLTTSLAQAIHTYWSRKPSAEHAPVINGDPFTNSQEYPTGFTLGQASLAGARARVPVRFDQGGRVALVEYALRKVDRAWFLDDLHYDDGSTLRGLLKSTQGR